MSFFNDVFSSKADESKKVTVGYTKNLSERNGHTKPVNSVLLLGGLLFTGADDSVVKIWNVQTSDLIQNLDMFSAGCRWLRIDGTTVYACTNDHAVRAWKFATKSRKLMLPGSKTRGRSPDRAGETSARSPSTESTTSEAMSESTPRGIAARRPSVASSTASISSSKKESLASAKDRLSKASAADFSVLSAGVSEEAQVFLSSGFANETILSHTSKTNCFVIAGGTMLAAGCEDGAIRYWNLEKKEKEGLIAAVTDAHSKSIECMDIIDDDFFVTGSRDKDVKIWNLKTRKCAQTLRKHSEGVLCLAVRGDQIASGGADQTIHIWSIKTGQCLMSLAQHTSRVKCLYFREDILWSSSGDGTIRMWDLQSGVCIGNIAPKGSGPINSFAHAGEALFLGCDDRTVKAVDLNAFSGDRGLTTDEARAMKDQHKQDLKRLQEHIEALDAEIVRVKATAGDPKEIAALNEKLEDAQSEISNLTMSLQSKESVVERLLALRDEAEQELDALRKKVDSLQEQNDFLQAELEAGGGNVEELHREIEQRKAAESQLAEALSKVATLVGENSEINEKCKSLEAMANEKLETVLKSLEVANQNLNEERASKENIEKEALNWKGLAAMFQGQNAECEAEVADVKEKMQVLEGHAKSANEARDKALKDLETQRAENESVKEQIRAIQEASQLGAKESLQKSEEHRKRLEDQISELQSQLAALQSSLEESNTKKASVQKEYTDATKAYAEKVSGLQDEVLQLREKKAELEASNMDLAKINKDAVQLVENLRGKLETSDHELAATKKALQLKEDELKDTQSAHRTLQTKADAVEEQLAQEKQAVLAAQQEAEQLRVEARRCEKESAQLSAQVLRLTSSSTDTTVMLETLMKAKEQMESDFVTLREKKEKDLEALRRERTEELARVEKQHREELEVLERCRAEEQSAAAALQSEKEQAIAQAQQHIESLQAEVALRVSEIQQCQHVIEEKSSEIVWLTETSEARIKHAESEHKESVARLEGDIEDMREAMREKEETIRSLEAALRTTGETAHSSIADLQKEKEEAVGALQRNIEELRGHLASNEQVVSDLRGELSTKEDALAALKSELAATQSSVAEKEKDVQQKQEEIAALQAAVAEKEKKAGDLQKQVEKLRKDLKRSSEQKQEELAAWEESLVEKEQEINTLRARIADLEATSKGVIGSESATAKDLTEKLERFESERREFEQQQQSLVESMRREKEEAEGKLENMVESLKALQEIKTRVQDELGSTTEKLDLVKWELQNVRSEKDDISNQLSKTTIQVEGLRMDKIDLENQIESLKQQHAADLHSAQESARSFESENQNLRFEKSDLLRDAADLRARVSELEASVLQGEESMTKEVHSLKEMVTLKAKEAETARKVMDDFKSRLLELKSSRDTLAQESERVATILAELHQERDRASRFENELEHAKQQLSESAAQLSSAAEESAKKMQLLTEEIANEKQKISEISAQKDEMEKQMKEKVRLLEKEIEAATSDVVSIKQMNASQLAESETKIVTLQAEVTRLLQAQDGTVQSYSKALEASEARVLELERELNATRIHAADAETQAKQIETTADQSIAELRRELAATQGELSRAQEALVHATEQVDTAAMQGAGNQQIIESYEIEKRRLESDIHELTCELESVREELRDLQLTHEECLTESSSRRESLALDEDNALQLRQKVATLSDRCGILARQNELLASNNTTLESDIADMLKKLQELSEQYESEVARNRKLTEDNERLAESARNAASGLLKERVKLSDAVKAAEEAKNAHELIKEVADKLALEKTELATRVELMSHELAALYEEIAAREGEIQQLDDRIDQLMAEKEAAVSTVTKQWEEELTRASDQQSVLVHEKESEISALKVDMGGVKEKLTQVIAEKTEAEQKILEERERKAALAQQVKEAETAVSKVTKERDSAVRGVTAILAVLNRKDIMEELAASSGILSQLQQQEQGAAAGAQQAEGSNVTVVSGSPTASNTADSINTTNTIMVGAGYGPSGFSAAVASAPDLGTLLERLAAEVETMVQAITKLKVSRDLMSINEKALKDSSEKYRMMMEFFKKAAEVAKLETAEADKRAQEAKEALRIAEETIKEKQDHIQVLETKLQVPLGPEVLQLQSNLTAFKEQAHTLGAELEAKNLVPQDKLAQLTSLLSKALPLGEIIESLHQPAGALEDSVQDICKLFSQELLAWGISSAEIGSLIQERGRPAVNVSLLAEDRIQAVALLLFEYVIQTAQLSVSPYQAAFLFSRPASAPSGPSWFPHPIYASNHAVSTAQRRLLSSFGALQVSSRPGTPKDSPSAQGSVGMGVGTGAGAVSNAGSPSVFRNTKPSVLSKLDQLKEGVTTSVTGAVLRGDLSRATVLPSQRQPSWVSSSSQSLRSRYAPDYGYASRQLAGTFSPQYGPASPTMAPASDSEASMSFDGPKQAVLSPLVRPTNSSDENGGDKDGVPTPTTPDQLDASFSNRSERFARTFVGELRPRTFGVDE